MGRPAPRYWWDFSRKPGEIIVESDYDKFPIVGRFYYPIDGQADVAIRQAEQLIDDLREGRKTPIAV